MDEKWTMSRARPTSHPTATLIKLRTMSENARRSNENKLSCGRPRRKTIRRECAESHSAVRRCELCVGRPRVLRVGLRKTTAWFGKTRKPGAWNGIQGASIKCGEEKVVIENVDQQQQL